MSRSHSHSRSLAGRLATGLVLALGLIAVVGATGCDDLLTAGLTGNYFGYPGTSFYDPTELISGVSDYRWSAMDRSNAGWDAYIRQ